MDFNKFNMFVAINFYFAQGPSPARHMLGTKPHLRELNQTLVQFPCCSVQVPRAPGSLAWCQAYILTYFIAAWEARTQDICLLRGCSGAPLPREVI